jgi:hypothetical protein
LHTIYAALLAQLHLSQVHREALRTRGLTDDEIDRHEYRTLPRQGRAHLARELHERFGDMLLSVPGIILKPSKDGGAYVTIAGAVGLLIPVRNPAGNIVALQVRRDDPGDGPRYFYLSSAKYGGPGPGTPPHVPFGIQAQAEVVRLTEGVLKADVAFTLSGLSTIGTARVGNWKPGLDALRELGSKVVRVAFDADAWEKPAVARALVACAEAAVAAGLTVELERWLAIDGKGIDELLAAGKLPEIVVGEAATATIAEALAAATVGDPLPPPDPLDRLDTVLAGGAECVYRDRELLQALARLAEEDPADFACRRARLQCASARPSPGGAQVSIAQFPAALPSRRGRNAATVVRCRARRCPDSPR